jgi:hypothetical protein
MTESTANNDNVVLLDGSHSAGPEKVGRRVIPYSKSVKQVERLDMERWVKINDLSNCFEACSSVLG